MQPSLLALLARRELARRAVGARLEVDVAEAALAALRHQRLLPVRGEIGDEFAGVGVGDDRADRHAQDDVVRAAAVLVGTVAVLAVLRAMNARVAVFDQRVDVAIRDGDRCCRRDRRRRRRGRRAGRTSRAGTTPTPLPPSPAMTSISTSSMNLMAPSAGRGRSARYRRRGADRSRRAAIPRAIARSPSLRLVLDEQRAAARRSERSRREPSRGRRNT